MGRVFFVRAHSKELLWLVVTAGAVGLAGAMVYPYSEAAATNRTLRRAEAFAISLKITLGEDGRFPRVEVVPGVETSAGIVIRGYVDKPSELEALKQKVEDAHPPVPVRWGVQVMEDNVSM